MALREAIEHEAPLPVLIRAYQLGELEAGDFHALLVGQGVSPEEASETLNGAHIGGGLDGAPPEQPSVSPGQTATEWYKLHPRKRRGKPAPKLDKHPLEEITDG